MIIEGEFMKKSEITVTDKYTIMIGLNDKDTYEQKFSTDTLVNIIRIVCKNYSVAFSLSRNEGGYIHENGHYTQENSLTLSLIGATQENVDEIAADICALFHQESVIISKEKVESYYLMESID